MARFTKTEMLEEFKEIVYQYARGVSFALKPGDGYRLLFGQNPADEADESRFMNPEVNSANYHRSFSIEHYLATRSIEQFYDYGILGIRNMQYGSVTEATEWTFAYGLIFDTARSFLISESLNSKCVTNTKCLYAAKAFFARLILDGSDRVCLPDCTGPDDMLTLAEVAMLADLDERTVRNATSANAANRLETSIIKSNIFIPREAAREWLQNKRGFIPTRLDEELPPQSVLIDQFISAEEAGKFIRSNRERLNLDQAGLAAKAQEGVTKQDLINIEAGQIINNETALTAIGNALGINGTLLALRLIQALKKNEMQELQSRIDATIK